MCFLHPNKTDSYGPQRMDKDGCARWLVQIIRGTAPKIRAVAKRGSTGGSDVVSQPSQSLGRKSPSSPHRRAIQWSRRLGRIEAALKVLGQEHSDARSCLEDVLKKARVSRDVSSRPPDVSVAEANAKVVRLEGSLAVLGPDARRRTASSRGGIVEGPGSRDSGARGAAVGRVREVLRTGSEAPRESTRSCDRGFEGTNSQRGGAAEGKRRLAVLRAEAAAQPAPEPHAQGPTRLTHLRRQVAQMEGELRQSHRAVSEKSLVESTLKQQVEHLMQEVAALRGSCAASRRGQKFKKRDWSPPFLGRGQPGWRKPKRNVSASPMLEVHLLRCVQVVQGSVLPADTEASGWEKPAILVPHAVIKEVALLLLRTGSRCCRQTMTSLQSLPQCPLLLERSGTLSSPFRRKSVTLLDALEFDLTQHDDSEEHRAMTDPDSSDVESLNDTADGMSEVGWHR